jgi:hypothetical protein
VVAIDSAARAERLLGSSSAWLPDGTSADLELPINISGIILH